jgi:hypothetical protein
MTNVFLSENYSKNTTELKRKKRVNATARTFPAKHELLTSGPSSNFFKFSVHEPPFLTNSRNTLTFVLLAKLGHCCKQRNLQKDALIVSPFHQP